MSPTRVEQDRAALIALMRMHPKRAEWAKLTEEIFEAGISPLEMWERVNPPDLLGPGENQELFDQALRDLPVWEVKGYRLHTFQDESYPGLLRSVRNLPPVVFTQGQQVADELGVCVVGSRDVSPAGTKFAHWVAENAAVSGLSVIAGLALGVDTAAHEAALAVGGRTVAVLGNGLDHVYPKPNARLQTEIADRGMLLSHFLPEYTPTRWSFPARNVTMSAIGLVTVIVEAGEKSGTRIQAREANQHGRPVILAKSVAQGTSWGRKLLDNPGVSVAASPDDALEQVQQIVRQRQTLSKWLTDAVS